MARNDRIAARVEVWVWVLVYGGLILAGLGLAVQRSADALGWTMVGAGGVGVAAGALLIWVRSRIRTGD